MGLFDFIKSQFIEVIEWTEQDPDVLVYRFPVRGQEIKNGASLTVREGQAAVFVNEGRFADVFAPGRHALSTANTPVLTKLGAWARGFNSPFKAEVYFVTTRQFTDQKWGTTNPVLVRDPEFGAVRLRAFGTYSFKVEDPATFCREAVGTDGLFTTDQLSGQLKSALASGFGDLAAESKVPLLDLSAHYDEIGQALMERATAEFKKFGLALRRCVVENISVPPEVEQAIDRAASSRAPSDLDRYTRVAAADALRASGAAGGAAATGAQIAAGLALGSAMIGAVHPFQGMGGAAPPAAPPTAPGTTSCPQCRAPMPAGAKFCPGCGAKTATVAAHCTACGTAAAPGSKFCSGCGAKMTA